MHDNEIEGLRQAGKASEARRQALAAPRATDLPPSFAAEHRSLTADETAAFGAQAIAALLRTTCGATDPKANEWCSNGFHVPPPRATDAAGLVEFFRHKGNLVSEKRDITVSHEDAARYREAAATIAAQAAEIERLRGEVGRLREAGNALCFAAETTGGTAGRDERLCAAIGGWAKAKALNRIERFERDGVFVGAGVAALEPRT